MAFIIKADDDRRLVFGEVYLPNTPDADNEYMSESDIEEMAHDFMRRGKFLFDAKHDNKARKGIQLVESFIAREGDPLFMPGAWVVGLFVGDDEVWKQVKEGKLNGFSFEGFATKVEKDVRLEITSTRKGVTTESGGHTHTITVRYDADGRFLGGETNEVDGHSHTIRKGTATELSAGHSHRFAGLDGVKIIGED